MAIFEHFLEHQFKHTLAAFHIILQRIDRIVFIVSLITSSVFLAFYVYMIIARIHESLVNAIFYSLMGVVLIVSTVFDIILYPGNKKLKDFLETKKLKVHKKVKNRTIAIVKTAVKLLSLGYATYELIMVDSSIIRLLTYIVSGAFFVLQVLVYFVSDLLNKYWNYLHLGYLMDKTVHHHPKEMIIHQETNYMLGIKQDEEILSEISEQVKIDEEIENNDDVLKNQIIVGYKAKRKEEKKKTRQNKKSTSKEISGS